MQTALEAVFGAATGDDRRRLLALVELLRRLAVEADAAITDPGARAWLEALPAGSKTGRAAREALAVTGAGVARSREAAAEVSRDAQAQAASSAASVAVARPSAIAAVASAAPAPTVSQRPAA